MLRISLVPRAWKHASIEQHGVVDRAERLFFSLKYKVHGAP